jgi:CHAT domain-containing protein
VSDLVLKPLLPALAGSSQWFLSPDAELNRVPFAALPAPQDPSKPLAQAIQLRLLTTGRELLRLKQPIKAATVPVVMANPAFERDGRASRSANPLASSAASQSRSADLAAKVWKPLPGSELEGQQVSAQLGTAPLTGVAASTRKLQQLKSPKVLHIASHGFFVGESDTKPNDPLAMLQDQTSLLRRFRGEDPQLRSGLVLAGANQPDADPNDDGYLTAAEAAALKLDGTELVVLSACSTGQGTIRTGEGVYGLQRALAVAGARSTLLSLWKVDDAATAEFMRRFYSRLKAGEPRSDALAATQEEFRSGSVRDAKTGQRWDSPYYWAAWQLVGDWRPIKGL